MATDYRAPNVEDSIALLAAHLPTGRLWNSKHDLTTVLGRLVAGLASGTKRSGERVERFVTRELDPQLCRDLILEWEESVGIPDECIERETDIADRRNHVFKRLQNFDDPITNEELVAVYAFHGFTVQLVPGDPDTNGVALGFPVGPYTADQERQIRHTMGVRVEDEEETFDYTFDIDFLAGSVKLVCLSEALLPANIDPVHLFGQDLGVPLVNP